MASGRLADYLGIGDEADIPVSLDLSAGAVGFFYAKDSNKLFAWDGVQWVLVLAGGAPAAEDVTYDNVSSGLSATDVQEAIDELAAGGGGDVTGPASSTAGNFALFADGTGKEIEDGGTPGEMAFVDDAPSDGQEYVRKDGDWAVASGGGGGGATAYTIVTESSAFTADPGTHDGLTTLTLAGGDVTFSDSEPYTEGMTFNIRATSPIELLEDSVTLDPPAGGTLELDAGMAVQVVFTDATTAVVIGQTVPA